MASLNSVTIELQVQNEKEATAALKRFSAESERLSTSVLDSANKLKSITSRWDQANQMVKDGTLTVKAHKAAQTQLARELAVLNGMYKSNGALATQTAAAQLRAADAARREAAEIEAVTRARQQDMQRMRQIRNQYREGYAAFTQARQAMRDLREAMQRGSITADQYAARIAEVREGYKLMSAGGRGARRSMNDTGLAIQQVGYQVSDFAVQVQSGASPFVALGQQGAQLAGILPLVHKQLGLTMTAAIGLSAGLGIAIPLITAAAGTLFNVSRNANSAEDALNDLESQLESARGETASFRQEIEMLNRGLRDTAELAFDEAVRRAEEELGNARVALVSATSGGDLPLELGGADESARAAAEASIAAAERRVELAEQELQAYRAAREQREVMNRMEEAAASWAEGRVRREQEALETLLEAGRVAEEGRLTREQMRRDLEAETALYQEIAQYGEDSRQVEALRAEQARAAYEARVRETTTNDVLVAQVMEYYDAMEEARRAAEGTADAVDRISPSLSSAIAQANAFADAMARARSESAGIGISTAGIQAEIAALQGGASQAEARAQAAAVTLREQLFAQFPTQGIGPSGATAAVQDIERQVEARRQLVLERERAQAELSRLRSSSTGGGGGGGGAAQQTAQDYLNQLFLEAQQRERLIGLSEEQRIREERRVEILNQVQDLQGTVSQERINQLLEEEERIRQLEQAEQRRQELMDVVQTNLESGLMALIDGSKSVEEAFRSMLRAILAEIAQQAIVEPIASGITSFLFSANGNAFSGGRVMPFANGGVVGGPTMFPMAGGRTGIMGEAGPEAIMPLKRTRGGKLGVAVEGGGSVVINQSFNFSANGDESVKRIIAEEAPRIANLTQRQILDQRRRGGVMKATF